MAGDAEPTTLNHSGTIKTYKAEKGFGFITCEDVEGDIYFHRKALPEELQLDNDHFYRITGKNVMFALTYGPDGKPQAKYAQVMYSEGEVVVGKVKSFSDMKGFGFITGTGFEKDVYFRAADVPWSHKGMPLEGAPVKFYPEMLEDGKIQAKRIGFPAIGGVPNYDTGAVLSGVVKNVDLEKGFGFLTKTPLHMDVHFKADQVEGGEVLEQGEAVNFELQWGTRDGRPHAIKVTRGLADGTQAQGVIKSLNMKTGYGFVTVPGQRVDVYFKLPDLPPDLQAMGEDAVGCTMKFDVNFTRDGKPQVRNGEYLSGIAKQAPPQGQQKRRANWTDDSWWGMDPSFGWGMGMDWGWYGGKGKGGKAGGKASGKGSWGGDWSDGGPLKKRRTERADDVVGMPANGSKGSSKGFSKGFGGGKGVAPKGGIAAGTTLQGQIKSFNPGNGWGFIQGSAIGADVYFMTPALPWEAQSMPIAGRSVSFTLKYGAGSRPQAESIQLK